MFLSGAATSWSRSRVVLAMWVLVNEQRQPPQERHGVAVPGGEQRRGWSELSKEGCLLCELAGFPGAGVVPSRASFCRWWLVL